MTDVESGGVITTMQTARLRDQLNKMKLDISGNANALFVEIQIGLTRNRSRDERLRIRPCENQLR